MEKIKSIPNRPGVYIMKGSLGNIIYIGKSKSLNKRVRSYFQRNIDFNKIKQLVFNIHDIETIITDTHLEAQILECSLIKKYKPIYNSQFKNDKKYIYLTVEENNRYNPLAITLERESNFSFGPYRSKNSLMELVNLLKNLYPIRKDKDLYDFNYHPLPAKMDEGEFKENRKSLIEILSHEKAMEIFISLINNKMEEASLQLQFERASYYRDLLSHFNYLFNSNRGDVTKGKEILAGEKLDDGYKLFYIVDGNLIYKKKFNDIDEDNIKDFIVNVKRDKHLNDYIYNEKSKLDFKTIINRELKTNPSIVVQYLDENMDLSFLNDFLNQLETTK